MTGLEIALLLIGVIFLVGSFFVSEKLSTSDIETMKKLSEKEISLILDKELGQAAERLSQQLEEKLEDTVDSFDRQTDKEVNRKILAIGEYTESIKEEIDKSLESMGKSHDEIVFMYDRLNDKQEHLTQMTRDLQAMESAVRMLDESISEKIQALHQEEALAEMLTQENEESGIPEETMEEVFGQKVMEEAASDSRPENANEQILSLHQQGYTEVEIARRLGRGLGEVKLVLGLFNEVKES